jgi:hypothetical protein
MAKDEIAAHHRIDPGAAGILLERDDLEDDVSVGNDPEKLAVGLIVNNRYGADVFLFHHSGDGVDALLCGRAFRLGSHEVLASFHGPSYY